MTREERERTMKFFQTNNVDFSNAVKITRKLAGKSLQVYGKRLKIPASRISDIEGGKANVTLSTAAKLLDIWGLELVVKRKSGNTEGTFDEWQAEERQSQCRDMAEQLIDKEDVDQIDMLISQLLAACEDGKSADQILAHLKKL